jgi:hypothetical protein
MASRGSHRAALRGLTSCEPVSWVLCQSVVLLFACPVASTPPLDSVNGYLIGWRGATGRGRELSANANNTMTSVAREATNCGAEHYSRGHKLCSHSVDSQHFMVPESSLPSSQELSTRTYTEPDHPVHNTQSYL